MTEPTTLVHSSIIIPARRCLPAVQELQAETSTLLRDAVSTRTAGARRITGARGSLPRAANAHAGTNAIGLGGAVCPGVRTTDARAAVIAFLAGVDAAVAARRCLQPDG